MKMRNRKTVIAVFLVLACMLVGVGYAATNGTLDLTITANSAAQDFKVLFTEVKATEINDSATDGAALKVRSEGTYLVTGADANTVTMSTTQATLVVEGMALTTDYATVEYTIKNYNNYKVELTITDPTTTSFNVTGGFVDGEQLVKTIVVPANAEVSYQVTVGIKANAGHTSVQEKIVIGFTGKAVD